MRWRFTDRICAFQSWDYILAIKACSLEEYSLLERWGEAGKAPAILLLESAVQTARWLVEVSSGFSLSADLASIEQWFGVSAMYPGDRCCSFILVKKKNESSVDLALAQKIISPGGHVPSSEEMCKLAEHGATYITMQFSSLQERYLPADRLNLWQEIGV